MLAEHPELSTAIDGVWNALMAGLASGQSCRGKADVGSCRTARRGADELPGVEAVLERSPGATETGWAVQTMSRLRAEKEGDRIGAGGCGKGRTTLI